MQSDEASRHVMFLSRKSNLSLRFLVFMFEWSHFALVKWLLCHDASMHTRLFYMNNAHTFIMSLCIEPDCTDCEISLQQYHYSDLPQHYNVFVHSDM